MSGPESPASVFPIETEATNELPRHGRVLSLHELDDAFPLSLDDQPHVLAVEHLQSEMERHVQAQRLQEAETAAAGLDWLDEQLAQAQAAFERIVGGALEAIEVPDLPLPSYRSKHHERLARKATVSRYDAAHTGSQPRIVTDLIAGEIVVEGDTLGCEDCDAILVRLHQQLGLPDTYPGGHRVVQLGFSEKVESAEGYPMRKLDVAFWYEGEMYIGEFRILNQAEKAYDKATHPAYERSRNRRYERASRGLAVLAMRL